MTVEYFVAGNGIIDDSGSSRMADRIAEDEAARGYPEAEKFAETWALLELTLWIVFLVASVVLSSTSSTTSSSSCRTGNLEQYFLKKKSYWSTCNLVS